MTDDRRQTTEFSPRKPSFPRLLAGIQSLNSWCGHQIYLSPVVCHLSSALRPALTLFIAITLICCVLYPFAITGIGQLAFQSQAAGSVVMRDGKPIGSHLIGQAFSSPRYFWGRPSATTPMTNNAMASNGSNLGPSNPVLIDTVKARIAALKAADPHNTALVPVDLVTASASGLDPDISIAAAYYQAARVARERRLNLGQIYQVISLHEKTPLFDLFGEPRVNVLALNLALDQIQSH